jgi:hypothetical protein
MRTSGALKGLIATCALVLIAVHLSPATAAPAAQLVTCVDLSSGKERISKTGTCRTTEAMAKWRLAPVDSAIASGITKSSTVCSNKESSPFTYQLIRSKCAKHMQSGLYTRSSVLPAKPVIAQVSSSSYESVSLALASDPAANLDAPVAYYTITSSKGDVKKVNSWRDLNLTISGLRSATSYTFTITATNVDGTSPVSASSLTVTTQVYVAPAAAVTSPPAPTYAIGDTGPGGGTVFYTSTAGFNCGSGFTSTGSPTGEKCYYLEAAPNTWAGGVVDIKKTWAINAYRNTDVLGITNETVENTSSAAIGIGYKNSVAIVNQGNGATTGAGAARAYTGGSKNDWYLPATAELNQLCKWARAVAWTSDATVCSGGTLNLGTGAGLGAAGFLNGDYWSSSEYNSDYAHYQNFGTGDITNSNNKEFINGYVRPIRAF